MERFGEEKSSLKPDFVVFCTKMDVFNQNVTFFFVWQKWTIPEMPKGTPTQVASHACPEVHPPKSEIHPPKSATDPTDPTLDGHKWMSMDHPQRILRIRAQGIEAQVDVIILAR